MINFNGKKGLVLGVGNQKSIAWAIAEKLNQYGAELGLTYLDDPKGRFEKNVRNLADQIGATVIHPCDVGKDEDIQSLINVVTEKWGELDFIVHSLAFAPNDEFGKSFSETGRNGFLKAQEISVYSLLPLCNGLTPLMKKRGGGSIITMTFVGSVLAVPGYNVMGAAKASLESSVRYLAREFGPDNIRVNAISPGPIRTLSASGVKKAVEFFQKVPEHTALKRTITQKEVANVSAFILSDEASAITGQVIYADGGYNILAN